MIPEIDIEKIVEDREAFNALIYTPLNIAVSELKKRSLDLDLEKKIKDRISIDIPIFLKQKKGAILFRQIATPNYEIRRFSSIIDAIDDLQPVFWEYYSDKFTSNNEYKRSLGKIPFFAGRGKKGGQIINRLNVIDFNTYNGNKLDNVKTLWGESLVDFHHSLFRETFPQIPNSIFFDASLWFKDLGGNAKEYYKNFLMLFVSHGILFENFMLDIKEIDFTKDVFLPAFLSAWKESGHKPLIVALEPTDIEGDEFWMCQPNESIEFVKSKF